MRLLRLGAVIVLWSAAHCAVGEENLIVRAVKSCQSDISNYCGHVKMGQGRIWACLLANDDKITSQCGMALNAVTLEFETVRAKADEIIRACETDRENFCPRAKWGQGGVVKCLASQSHTIDSVSRGCRYMLEKHGLE
jgi:hypothetical protein